MRKAFAVELTSLCVALVICLLMYPYIAGWQDLVLVYIAGVATGGAGSRIASIFRWRALELQIREEVRRGI